MTFLILLMVMCIFMKDIKTCRCSKAVVNEGQNEHLQEQNPEGETEKEEIPEEVRQEASREKPGSRPDENNTLYNSSSGDSLYDNFELYLL